MRRSPCGKDGQHALGKGSEFRSPENGGLHLMCRDASAAVPSAAVCLEEYRAQGRKHLPIAFQCVDVAVRDTTIQVGIEIVQIFGFAAIDVAWEVEVVVVRFD